MLYISFHFTIFVINLTFFKSCEMDLSSVEAIQDAIYFKLIVALTQLITSCQKKK
jgi:hypothetical protein